MEDKIKIFIEILEKEENNYGDIFNEDIEMAGENHDYKFLRLLNSYEDIKYWVQKLKSRIIMKEDVAGLNDIIEDYIEFG